MSQKVLDAIAKREAAKAPKKTTKAKAKVEK